MDEYLYVTLENLGHMKRDAQLAGDATAGTRFDRGHKLSVTINMLQLVGLLVILLV